MLLFTSRLSCFLFFFWRLVPRIMHTNTVLAPTNLCETLPPPALFLPTAHVLAVINDCHHLSSLYFTWVNIFCGWCTSCHHMPTSRRLGLPARASEFVPNPLRFTPLQKHLIIPACSHFAFTSCHIPVVHPCTSSPFFLSLHRIDYI